MLKSDFKLGALPAKRASFAAVSTDNFTIESMTRKAPGLPVEWSMTDFWFVHIWKHAVLDVESGMFGLILA